MSRLASQYQNCNQNRWQIKKTIDNDHTLPRFIRLAILKLFWHGGHHGVAYPYQSTVAKAVGCTRRTVIRAVEVAEANGWLRVERRGRRSAEYIWAWSERFGVTGMSPEMSPQEAPAPYIGEMGVNVQAPVAHNPALEIPVEPSETAPTLRAYRPTPYFNRPYDEYREAFRREARRMRQPSDNLDKSKTPPLTGPSAVRMLSAWTQEDGLPRERQRGSCRLPNAPSIGMSHAAH